VDTALHNVWSAPGPQHELDLDTAIQQAREIYRGVYPGEEFLPRAPDPEEIIIGGGEEGVGTGTGTGTEESGTDTTVPGEDTTTETDAELAVTGDTVENVETEAAPGGNL